jgi:hypothetical protein
MNSLSKLWKRHSHNIRGAVAAFAMFALAAGSLVYAATPNFGPRMFETQQTHYLRFTFNFNSCTPVAGVCSVKVGAVPYNAWILRAYQQIATSFNSLTSDTLSIGVTSASANELVAAQSIAAAAGGATALTVISTAAGTVITGAGATPSGANGGFDIWVKWTEVGTVATAGAASYIIEYAAPNDGQCSQSVALGATKPAC